MEIKRAWATGVCTVKACMEQDLSEPRSINISCSVSEKEDSCCWSHVAMEAQEKPEQISLPLLYEIGYSLHEGIGQHNAAVLYSYSSAVVGSSFQKYSELDEDLLRSFSAHFSLILCWRICAFWYHSFLTGTQEFTYPLTVPTQGNCGLVSSMDLENSWEHSHLQSHIQSSSLVESHSFTKTRRS